MNFDDDNEDEEERKINLRDILSDEEYRAFSAESGPENPEDEVPDDNVPDDEVPDVTVYQKTPFGDIPITSNKGDVSEGLGIGEVGMGKLLVMTGLALVVLGVSLELYDRMSRTPDED